MAVARINAPTSVPLGTPVHWNVELLAPNVVFLVPNMPVQVTHATFVGNLQLTAVVGITNGVNMQGMIEVTLTHVVQVTPPEAPPPSTAPPPNATAPTTPPSITFPAVTRGVAFTVSWGASTGGTQVGDITYILERQQNGGTWAEIWSGTALTHSTSTTANTVNFRVRARRGSGALHSGWRTGTQRGVAPAQPTAITVPTTINGGVSFPISWTGSSGTFTLQRQLNGGTWTDIWTGTARNTTDTVAFGTNTVNYRVRGSANNLDSAWRTGTQRTVLNNNPPTISGSNSNLGVQTGAFSHAYIVNDPDTGDTVTVVERLNNTQLRQFTATLGAVNTLAINMDTFRTLANGVHTLTIIATDQHGASATRTITFSRNETKIDVTLLNPLSANDMPKRSFVSIFRQIPDGASFKVEICNNANDPNPTWENCTQAVELMQIYHFNNTQKTTANWGVNIRIQVDRNNAVGDCWIGSIVGTFDNVAFVTK